MDKITIGQIYLIKDSFFELVKDNKLSLNKNEKRPHLCIRRHKDSSFYWLIPMSSNIKACKQKQQQEIKKHGKSINIAIIKHNNKQQAFILQNAFSILPKYIKCEWLENKQPLILEKKSLKEITTKFKQIIYTEHKGRIIQPNTRKIIKTQIQALNKPKINYSEAIEHEQPTFKPKKR